MKIFLLRPILCFVISMSGLFGRAQSTDTALIKETALNYVEGYYNADADRVIKALSPELVKRIIFSDETGDAIQTTGYSLFVFGTRKNKNQNTLNPGEPFKGDVIIYDIGKNIATAKVVTNKFKFIDYLQLARLNGAWKIINVLWEFTSK